MSSTAGGDDVDALDERISTSKEFHRKANEVAGVYERGNGPSRSSTAREITMRNAKLLTEEAASNLAAELKAKDDELAQMKKVAADAEKQRKAEEAAAKEEAELEAELEEQLAQQRRQKLAAFKAAKAAK